MTTESFIKYDNNYLPGYTGHVPKKDRIFGCTAGDINNLIAEKEIKQASSPNISIDSEDPKKGIVY